MTIKITTEEVKELRDKTGVSVMQCRQALEEAEGDMEKALIILKNKSSSIAMKKADREAHDGVVVSRKADGRAILVTLHCETDFVAKNEDFINLANTLADIALNEGIEAMKNKSIDLINQVIQKVGEKIKLGEVLELDGSTLGSYVHGGKSAVVVSLEGGNEDLARDVAMQLVAMKDDQRSILEQPFIKNPDMNVGQLLAQSGANLVRFIRVSIG